MTRPGLHPAMRYRGLRFARTADEAFRTERYAAAIEPHIPPPLWVRITLFLRRRFA